VPHRLCCAPQAMLCSTGYAVPCRLCCAPQAMLCSTGYAVLRRLCCAPQAMLCPTGYAVPCRLFCALQAICSRVIMFLLCLIDCPACLGGTVGSVTLCAAWLRWSASPGSRPGLARSLCQVIAVYALILNSRAGTEGSTVSSLICDCWLMLSSETLSISRCLNHW